MKKFRLDLFLINILVPQFLGLLSMFFAGNVGAKYQSFNLPMFAPPKSAFMIIWPILFLLMGIANYIIEMEVIRDTSKAKFYYSAQLGMNFLWSIIFFGLDKKFFAFIWILLMIIVVIKCIIEFFKINKFAGLLLIPYLIWLIFAAYLNFGVWAIN